MFISVETIRNNVVDKHKIVTQKNVNINNSVVVEVTVLIMYFRTKSSVLEVSLRGKVYQSEIVTVIVVRFP